MIQYESYTEYRVAKTHSIIFIHHFPQKSPTISGSLTKNDLQIKAFSGSWSPCMISYYIVSYLKTFRRNDVLQKTKCPQTEVIWYDMIYDHVALLNTKKWLVMSPRWLHQNMVFDCIGSRARRNTRHIWNCKFARSVRRVITLQRTVTYWNTLQHTATHCNALQHTAKVHNHFELRLRALLSESLLVESLRTMGAVIFFFFSLL